MIQRTRAATRSKSWWVAGALLLATGSTLISACGTRLNHSEIQGAGGTGSAVTSSTGSAGSSTTGAVDSSTSSTGAVDSSTSSTGAAATTSSTGSVDSSTSSTGAASSTTGAATSTTGASATTSTTGGSASSSGGGGSSATSSTSTTGTKSTSTTGTKTSTTGTAATTSSTGTAPAATGTSGANVINSAIFGGTAPCVKATGSPVNIGNDSTLSGVLGVLFGAVKPAMQLWAQSQNNCGGLNGHVINLFVADDQDDPSTAVAQGNDLIQNKHIIAFVGNIQVLTIDAMKPLIEKTKVPMVGGDITNNTWFSSPYIFPQGPPVGAIPYSYAVATKDYYHTTKLGHIFCFEVPQACKQIDQALSDLAPKLGITVVKSIQVSITAPSYTSQCLALQSAGAETVALTFDAPSQARFAASCDKVGYHPNYTPYPLGVGNEGEFFAGGKLLGNAFVPLNTFPWMTSNTPAEKYYQTQVANLNPSLKSGPGSKTGDAASLGWSAGALMVLASANLPANNPQPSDITKQLYTFKNQAFTQMGGLVPAPLDYSAMASGGIPVVPYCGFATVSNADNTGWDLSKTVDKATCTTVTAAGQPK